MKTHRVIEKKADVVFDMDILEFVPSDKQGYVSASLARHEAAQSKNSAPTSPKDSVSKVDKTVLEVL